MSITRLHLLQGIHIVGVKIQIGVHIPQAEVRVFLPEGLIHLCGVRLAQLHLVLSAGRVDLAPHHGQKAQAHTNCDEPQTDQHRDKIILPAARPGGEEQHLTSQQHQGCRRGNAHHQLPVKARHKVITQEEDARCNQAGAQRQAAHPAAGGVLQLCSFRPGFRLRRCCLIRFVHRRPPHSPAVPALRGPPGSPGRPAEC